MIAGPFLFPPPASVTDLLTPRSLARFRRRLLHWFAQHARSLPWRQTRDPYAIWVSEVMLQQTQVATVINYFPRFLEAFPDVAALARADEQAVLRLWEGLGYYRRARALHQAAGKIQRDFAGLFPEDPASLATLPGLGRYTVNAVLSQAFDQRLPIVEANSQRVLCRLLAISDDPRTPTIQRRLWETAEELLPHEQVGQFNQALMELGALICTAAKPDCPGCPVAKYCLARQTGQQEALPHKSPPPRIETVQEVAVVVRRADTVLLAQRPAQGRWANLWEFPHTPFEPQEPSSVAAERLLASLAIDATVGAEIMTIQHAVTRFRITLMCFDADFIKGTFRSDFYQQGIWVAPPDLHAYPVSSPQRRLARQIG